MLSASLAAAPAHAKKAPTGAYGTGDLSHGEVFVPLERGAAVPFELMVMPTPGECSGHVDLSLAWDQADNEVEVRLSGPAGTLEPYPDVDRTEGVDWLPNPHFSDPVDFVDGRYQLWVIAAGGPIALFYYDPATLDLLGSQYDFAVPPPAIPVFFPTLYMTSLPMFQPAADGSVDEQWTMEYDAIVRGDLPQYSHHVVSFPPPNLCGADPNRLHLSTLRTYVSDPLPANQARPWSDYLRDGLLFDVTIEPSSYYLDPPKTTTAATYSGATAIGGGIPRGWTFDIDAAFMNVAPPIRPWAGAGSCEPWWGGVHTTGLNICGGAP
ncbi:MAG: hypothetical protein KDK70_11320 [Myxococcales bacterium]|nr:hypothetical protein [Myxococcales bacterium]